MTPSEHAENDSAREGVVAVLQESRALGFLGPTPLDEQIAHAAAFAGALVAPPQRGVDMGSGGGLPGLVLATLVFPEASWVLLDGSVRRAEFLRFAVEALNIGDRVTVDDRRAELVGRDPAHRGAYDVVVSRSFGKPAVTAECASPLLGLGGWLCVSEPPQDSPAESATVRWNEAGLDALGMTFHCIVEGPPSFALLHQERVCPDRYPRRVGIPAKRPLFS